LTPAPKAKRALASSDKTQQQILGAAIQEMLQDDIMPDEGEDMMSDYLILGALIAPKIKAKIWKGEYVDLTTLGEGKDQAVSVAVNKNDSLIRLTQSNPNPPGNIHEWLRLFATYAAVYVQAFPEQAAAIMSYMIRILDMQRSYGGLIWRSYDEKFRKVKGKCQKLPWHVVNWQIALPCINMVPGTSGNKGQALNKRPFRDQPGTSAQGQASGQTGKKSRIPRGYCFKYDKSGSCPTKDCKFNHLCSICGGKGHNRHKCPQKGNSSNTSKNTSP
jgi:hypothetical protein